MLSDVIINGSARPASGLGKPQDRGLHNADFSLRAAVMIALTFLPYIAIPTSSHTNAPVAALFAALYLRELLNRPRLLVPVLFVALAPLLMLFVQKVLGYGEGNIQSIILWILAVASLGGVAGATVTSPHTVRLTVRVFLLASAAYVVVQKFFLDRGTIPFLALYDVSGYWSVPANAEVITKYIRRPFGWFPEPSFMAGSLALGAMALILLSYIAHRRLPAIDFVAVAAVIVAMVLGQSGSALFTVPVLVAMVFLPFSSPSRRAWFLLVCVACVPLAIQLIRARNETPMGPNQSWDDRGSSIIAGMHYLLDSPTTFLLGIGCHGGTVLYQNGKIPLDGLLVHFRLLDIFSVSGRMLLENGAVVGGAMLLTLIIPIVRGFAAGLSWSFGVLAAIGWLVIVTLTISYDGAAWLWALPGVCLGILALISEGSDEKQGGRLMNTAQMIEPGRYR